MFTSTSGDVEVQTRLWFWRIDRVIWLDEVYQPFIISLIRHGRIWRDNMDPRPTGMQGDEMILCIHEIERAQDAGLSFVVAVAGRPKNIVCLSIAKQGCGFFLPEAEIDLKLVMSKAEMLREYHDDIFECRLPAGQTIRGRDEFPGGIRLIGEAQIGLRDGVILPA